MNILVVLVGLMTIYCSIRLAVILNSKFPNIWWIICPILVVWGVMNRFLIVMFYDTGYVEEIAALNLVWWVGITILIRQIRIVAEDIFSKK
jgi:hypothetical protein